jgi:hypothetical protein
VLSLLLALALVLIAAPTGATDYYAKPNGSTSADCLSQLNACTIQRVLGLAAFGPGTDAGGPDTLWLMDGVYQGSAGMIAPAAGKNGTSTAPITVKAINESGTNCGAGVCIDGQFARIPINLGNNSWWIIEGVNAKQGTDAVVYVYNGATNNIIRRVVAWDAWIHNNSIIVGTDNARGNLFEDVGIFGTGGRVFAPGFGATAGTPRNVGRRVWARYEGNISQVFVEAITLNYGSFQGATCENCLATMTYESQPQTYFITNPYTGLKQTGSGSSSSCTLGPGFAGYVSTCGTGIQSTNYNVFGNRLDQGAILDLGDGFGNDKARAFGSLAYVTKAWGTTNVPASVAMGDRDLTLRDVFSYVGPNRAASGSDPGFSQANRVKAFHTTNVTATPAGGTASGLTSAATIANDFAGTIVVSDLQTTTTFSGVQPVLTAAQNPWSGTTGAQLCKQWVNEQVTTTPLWPWPMNDRIRTATAAAGNYFSNSGPGCSSTQGDCTGTLGHTRTETNVTSEVESLLGTIPAECRSDSTVPPTPPTGPLVQYFINEAASGQTPTSLVDAEGNLNLTLTYGAQPSYVEEVTGRGLEWGTLNSVGGASAAVDGTAVKTALQGAQKATLVAVADITDATADSAVDTPWRLALAPVGTDGMAVIVNGVSVRWTGFDWPAANRVTIHAVIDTTQAADVNRVRLYVDGVDQGDFDAGTAPAQNATFDLETSKRLNIGNHDLTSTNNQSIKSRIYYASIIAAALTSTEVATNAACLALDDDTEDCTGVPDPEPPPSSVVYVGNGQWQAHNSVTTLTPGLVFGSAAGDRTLAIVVSRRNGSDMTVTMPTSSIQGGPWTLVDSCYKTQTREIALQVFKAGTVPTQAPAVAIDSVGLGWSVALVQWRNTPTTVSSADSSNNAAATWTPTGVTTTNDNTRVISVVATPDENQLSMSVEQNFVPRLTGTSWDTGFGPMALGMADMTQGVAGAVTMPTWQQELNGDDEWCGITVALDLITIPQVTPPTQGGGPAPVPRFVITDRPTVSRPAITDRPAVTPVVP